MAARVKKTGHSPMSDTKFTNPASGVSTLAITDNDVTKYAREHEIIDIVGEPRSAKGKAHLARQKLSQATQLSTVQQQHINSCIR